MSVESVSPDDDDVVVSPSESSPDAEYPWWRHGVLSIMRYLLLLPVTITVGYYLVTQVGPRLIQMMMTLLQTTTGKGLFGLGVSAAVLTALAAAIGN